MHLIDELGFISRITDLHSTTPLLPASPDTVYLRYANMPVQHTSYLQVEQPYKGSIAQRKKKVMCAHQQTSNCESCEEVHYGVLPEGFV
jgi:hypothetical protein